MHNLNPNPVCRVLSPISMALATLVSTAQADVRFIPHATAGYEHNSNLFQVGDANARLDSNGQPRMEDSTFNYGAGIDVAGRWGENQLNLQTNLLRSTYEYFDQLNRNDQLIGLTYDWVATRKITGSVNARYDEHQTPFTDLVADPNAVNVLTYTQIDRTLGFSANYQISTQWQPMTELGYSRTTVPWVGGRGSYDLESTAKAIGLRYVAKSKLSFLLRVDRNDGSYINVDNAPDYHSTRYQGSIDYTISPRTTLTLALGHAQYTQREADTSAYVGGLNFTHQLTEKTRYYLRYDRSLDAYATTQGSNLASTASGGITWQALPKIGFATSYSYGKNKVKADELGLGVPAPDRQDTMRSYQISMNYGIQRWVTIVPYYRHQQRDAELPGYDFKNSVYGVTLALQYR